MHHADIPPGAVPPGVSSGPWYRELNRYHWFVLAVCALGWLFDTMDQQLFVLVRQPAIAELLDLAPGHDTVRDHIGYATSIFMIGWATGGLVFGWLGDRIGRARAMVLTILMYSMFTGLSALSVTWIDFAVYRFLTGMGVGGEFAAGVSLVAEVMPQRARPYALSLLQALSTVGNVMALGVFYLVFSLAPEQETTVVSAWRIVFLVGTLPALLALYIRRRLKEPERWQQARQAADELHRRLGDISEMFGDRRWRRHTIVGVLLAASGVTALWGIIFWIPELVRSFVPEAEQKHYVTMAMLMLNVGAFFGIYGFSVLSGVVGRRPAFAVAFLLAFASTVAVFGFMSRTAQIWWMVPLLGFSTLMI
ncbi:MAG TPA: MFS transporter, partial [Planctomycetaceae bacterium]|nr:MFS transporter [Planctomycetaceae bacterium]